MRELTLDAGGWINADDVHDAIFTAIGAPSWHGRNLDALWDSIGTGEIKGVEVPYRLVIEKASSAGPDARRMIHHVSDIVEQLKAGGRAVEMYVHA